MRWIFGSFKRDALFLMVPALTALILARADILQTNLFYIFLVTGFADSGHIYTTVWRTWFHPTERQRSAITWLIPLAVGLTFFTWSALKLPYMWSFVIYATIHHNWKQYYGVTRWYETLNRHPVRWSGFFSKALMIVPVVAYHFRATSVDGFYSDGDLFRYPNATLFLGTICVYLGLLSAWIAAEVQNYNKGYREWNRILSIAFSSLIYGGAFFFGTTVEEVLFAPVLGHGIGYMAMTSLALNRTRPKRFATFAKAAGILGATALVFGGFETLVEKRYINYDPLQTTLAQALIIGFYLIPLFSHFIFDMYLWKRTHWEARLVYGFTGKRADVTPFTVTESHPHEASRAG